VGIFWECAQRWLLDVDAVTRCVAERRSLPDWALASLVNDPRLSSIVTFVGLHHPAALINPPPAGIDNYTPGIRDFGDTSACIEQLDLVVSVDAVVANLSAMMGKPTLVLTPSSREWRWGSSGTTTPWMAGVHVLAQKQEGEWAQAIEQAVTMIAGFNPEH
jgi:hypothetical protein